MPGRSFLSGTPAREGFTGKERDDETGFDYFGARYYNPALARWMNPDPLMDEYPGWSPYNYVFNNPLRFIDPDGREITNARGYTVSNPTLRSYLRRLNIGIMQRTGLQSSDFTIRISGGDRVRDGEGNPISLRTGKQVGAQNSRHLQEMGALAVDMVIENDADGVVTKDFVLEVARELDFDPDRSYASGWLHLVLPGTYEEDYTRDQTIDRAYVPTRDDFEPLRPPRVLLPRNDQISRPEERPQPRRPGLIRGIWFSFRDMFGPPDADF